jgi:hypothetical protein
MAVVGGHKLTGKSFEGLKPGCEISDEVHFTSLFQLLVSEKYYKCKTNQGFVIPIFRFFRESKKMCQKS